MKKIIRPRNIVARELRDPRFKMRVVTSKKAYTRKGKVARHCNNNDGHY